MAAILRLAAVLALCACASTQQYEEDRAPRYIASQQKVVTTPVPILKQINRHNEDGSYTYGFEAADGTFKIETKEANGEVKGKYGYKDDTGKVRVIEYGANKYGFQPSGEGITVAPPTLVDDSTSDEGLRPGKGQSGRSQYRAQPQQQAVDYDYEENTPPPRPRPQPQQYRPAPQQYRPAPQQYNPAPPPPQLRPQSAPAPPKPMFFAGAAPAPAAPERESFFNPAPQQYKQPKVYRPPQQQQHQQTFQQYQPQQQAQPRYSEPQQFPHANQQFSMLDQLLKEYSLPQGGSKSTHDVTFGTF